MNAKLVKIFLRDHLPVLAGGTALVDRMLDATEDAEIRAFLEELRPELIDDRRAAEASLRSLGDEPPRARYGLARLGEKLGRLKLNGAVTGYTPLSRLVELEGLGAVIAADQALWEGLERAGLSAEDARRRAARAAGRLDESVELRRLASSVALGGGDRRL